MAAVREELGWPHAPFVVPQEIRTSWDATEKGFASESAWNEKLVAYEEEYPELAMELVRRIKGQLPGEFSANAEAYIQQCLETEDNIACR